MKYTQCFNDRVNEKLPKEVVDFLAKYGWNPLGIYEVVKDLRAEFRRKDKPVFRHEEP